MDFQQIKEFIEKEGGKVLIVENGKPTLVVMTLDEYQGKSSKAITQPTEKREDSRPPVPQQNAPAREPVRVEQKEAPEELTIEDLPI